MGAKRTDVRKVSLEQVDVRRQENIVLGVVSYCFFFRIVLHCKHVNNQTILLMGKVVER